VSFNGESHAAQPNDGADAPLISREERGVQKNGGQLNFTLLSFWIWRNPTEFFVDLAAVIVRRTKSEHRH
jgi:hypothetical protein